MMMVAMSGGVDSSLVAALLLEQGHHVVGATMVLWAGDTSAGPPDAVVKAQRVCEQLGIPHHTLDCQQEFRRHVIQYFIEEYSRGYTPNPCIACNREIKFGLLWRHAQQLGCDEIASGHYAQVVAPGEHEASPEHYALLRGKDLTRDQSYVLYMLQQHHLRRLHLPLGTMSKADVRQQSVERGLVSANQPESHDICFIPDGNYHEFLRQEVPEAIVPGPILDQNGCEIGTHRGLPLYTVGQRKGLGISTTHRLFVTGLDPSRNALMVGPFEAAFRQSCVVEQSCFVNGEAPETPFLCDVQVRAHATVARATATPLANQRIRIAFDTPQRAITPGQSAVLYDDNRVIGGGRIAPEPMV